MPAADEAGATPDHVLSGRLRLFQPPRGHRVGTDAMLLIAAAPACDAVVDLGSGVGSVGLGMLALGRATRAWLVERDPAHAALSRRNVELNGMSGRAQVVEADIASPAGVLAKAGLPAGVADLVLANPPFNQPGRHRASPDASRAEAHAMEPDDFAAWSRAAARALRPGGRFVLIHRPEALVWLLPQLAARFGALTVRPVHPRAEDPARRVLIGCRLDSKAPARILPALVLHGADGAFTGPAQSINAGEGLLAS